MSEKEKVSHKGRVVYSHAILDAKKDRRRQEAEARQRDHNMLTTAQKIKKAKARVGESKRELARLEARMATEKAPAVKSPPATEAQKAVKAVKRAKSAAKAATR